MAKSNSVPRVLHCHSSFSAGGKEVRSVQLMNAVGRELDHTVVSGNADETGARALIARGVKAQFPTDFPSLNGWPTPGRLVAIAKAMAGYDLVLTYNFGAMDVVMAHTVFAEALGLPPLIHHEDGFNEDEAGELKARRNWYRRIATGRTHAMVVPSQTLENIALDVWKQPRPRLHRIPNGIDTKRFGRKPASNALRLIKREGENWIGTLAGLRPVKQLPMLVEACAQLPENWHLVILGDGPEKEAIQAAAAACEISHRVHLPGAVSDPSTVIDMFDIFALSSKSEQFPLSVVEAMAAGLPVAAPDVGDVKAIVSDPNKPFIARPGSADALRSMLDELVANADLRAQLGKANRERARARFDEAQMIEAYRALYWGAMGREG